MPPEPTSFVPRRRHSISQESILISGSCKTSHLEPRGPYLAPR